MLSIIDSVIVHVNEDCIIIFVLEHYYVILKFHTLFPSMKKKRKNEKSENLFVTGSYHDLWGWRFFSQTCLYDSQIL